VTSIFVTHDQEEALEVANRVVVMDKGRIEQIGTPGDVYEDPATAFVHGFIGESIMLPVDVRDGRIQFGDRLLDLESQNARSGPSKLFIRRHDFALGPAGSGALEGAVTHVRAFRADASGRHPAQYRRSGDPDRNRCPRDPRPQTGRYCQSAAPALPDFAAQD